MYVGEGEIQFEEGLKRLEEILSLMESGDITIEESIKYFKEGASLYKKLWKKLEDARQEIKIITEDFEGKIKEEDYSPSK